MEGKRPREREGKAGEEWKGGMGPPNFSVLAPLHLCQYCSALCSNSDHSICSAAMNMMATCISDASFFLSQF